MAYNDFTREMRFKAYALAKQIIFERTGWLIPPAEHPLSRYSKDVT